MRLHAHVPVDRWAPTRWEAADNIGWRYRSANHTTLNSRTRPTLERKSCAAVAGSHHANDVIRVVPPSNIDVSLGPNGDRAPLDLYVVQRVAQYPVSRTSRVLLIRS